MSELLIIISSVLVAEMGKNSIRITLPIESKTTKGNKTVKTPVLLDTGAGGIFMNKSYTKKHNIEVYELNTPIIPHNVDGSLNQAGKITHYTWIWTKFQDITILVRLLITNIRSQDIIFGLPWFKDYDPQIDWNTGKITIQKKAKTGWLKYSQDNQARLAEIKGKETVTIHWIEEVKKTKPKKKKLASNSLNWRSKEAPLPEMTKLAEELQEEEPPMAKDTDEIKGQGTLLTTVDMKETTETMEEGPTELTQASINVLAQLKTDNSPLEELWINAKTNISQKLAIQETVEKKEKTLEEMVPQELLNYKDVFNKVMAEHFPESQPWDHAIDLKEDFVSGDTFEHQRRWRNMSVLQLRTNSI